MSDADRERWNRRYAAAETDWRPLEWLLAHEALIRPRQPNLRALDLACGTGQNALCLARLGYQVDAWDVSDVALDLLRSQFERAEESLRVTPRQVDLDVASIPAATYDLVLDINFLERRLFNDMAEALRPDGLLLIRALMRKPAGDERNPAYLLEPGELASEQTLTPRPPGAPEASREAREVGLPEGKGAGAFAQLETLEYAEDAVEGWAALIARRTA